MAGGIVMAAPTSCWISARTSRGSTRARPSLHPDPGLEPGREQGDPLDREVHLGVGHGGIHWVAAFFYLVLPYLTEELGLSYAEAGALVAVFHAASAAANGVFIGAINRVGTEEPWATSHNMGEFYGSSYIVNPRGTIEAQASYGDDELLVHEIDLDMVREVRDTWQFFRDRRPETYGPLTDG